MDLSDIERVASSDASEDEASETEFGLLISGPSIKSKPRSTTTPNPTNNPASSSRLQLPVSASASGSGSLMSKSDLSSTPPTSTASTPTRDIRQSKSRLSPTRKRTIPTTATSRSKRAASPLSSREREKARKISPSSNPRSRSRSSLHGPTIRPGNSRGWDKKNYINLVSVSPQPQPRSQASSSRNEHADSSARQRENQDQPQRQSQPQSRRNDSGNGGGPSTSNEVIDLTSLSPSPSPSLSRSSRAREEIRSSSTIREESESRDVSRESPPRSIRERVDQRAEKPEIIIYGDYGSDEDDEDEDGSQAGNQGEEEEEEDDDAPLVQVIIDYSSDEEDDRRRRTKTNLQSKRFTFPIPETSSAEAEGLVNEEEAANQDEAGFPIAKICPIIPLTDSFGASDEVKALCFDLLIYKTLKNLLGNLKHFLTSRSFPMECLDFKCEHRGKEDVDELFTLPLNVEETFKLKEIRGKFDQLFWRISKGNFGKLGGEKLNEWIKELNLWIYRLTLDPQSKEELEFDFDSELEASSSEQSEEISSPEECYERVFQQELLERGKWKDLEDRCDSSTSVKHIWPTTSAEEGFDFSV